MECCIDSSHLKPTHRWELLAILEVHLLEFSKEPFLCLETQKQGICHQASTYQTPSLCAHSEIYKAMI